jgi:hypothetical protein
MVKEEGKRDRKRGKRDFAAPHFLLFLSSGAPLFQPAKAFKRLHVSEGKGKSLDRVIEISLALREIVSQISERRAGTIRLNQNRLSVAGRHC